MKPASSHYEIAMNIDAGLKRCRWVLDFEGIGPEKSLGLMFKKVCGNPGLAYVFI